MKEKKTWILLLLLFFGALCFGGGVFYGQFMLTEKGFLYEEAAADNGDQKEEEVDIPTESDQNNDNDKAAGKVNLNKASAGELQMVPGLGAVTAEKIVTSRNGDGAFPDVHELVERGILGEGKLKQLAPYLEAE